MRFRSLAIGAAVSLAAGVASLGAGTAAGGTVPPSSDPPATSDVATSGKAAELPPLDPKEIAVEIQTYAKHYGVDEDEAYERLSWQRNLGAFTEAANAEFSDDFGGVWIDPADGGRIKVGVTADAVDSGLSRIAEAAQTLGIAEAVDVVPVKISFDRLAEGSTWLGSQIASLVPTPDRPVESGLATDKNTITLRFASPQLTKAEQTLVDAATAQLGEALTVSFDAQPDLVDGCVHPYCDSPLRAGIRISATGAGCTGSFIAKSKVDTKYYQFTAGHCMVQASGTSWTTRDTAGTTRTIGPEHSWNWGTGYCGGTACSSSDRAIVRVSDVPFWGTRGFVFVRTGPHTTPNTLYPIRADGFSTVNLWVCMSGGTTVPTECGSVVELNNTGTPCISGGTLCATITGRAKANYCRQSGDSGAPVFALNTAYGLHSSGSGCTAYYIGIRGSETALNVDVVFEP